MKKLLLSALLASGLTFSGAGVFAAGENEYSGAEQKQHTEQTKEQTKEQKAAVENQDTGLTISEINDNPNKYIGQTVTVSGDLEESYGPKAFVIDGQGSIFNDEILVVTKKATQNIPQKAEGESWYKEIESLFKDKNNVVQVTGTVHRFVEVEAEREIDWDLQPEIEAEFKNKL
ncbi:MAG TPA: hypothetical protein VLB01_05405, partial [Thermodesulfobacteriota bacterium]|nr:hypothetical protein [Thermodesulfobacteriota bacterium]